MVEKRTRILIEPKAKLLAEIEKEKQFYGTRSRTVIALIIQALEAKK